MAERPAADPFCPNCGTEVDADARFCPTCGRTLLVPEPGDAQERRPLPEDEPTAAVSHLTPDEAPEPIPPAPSWPPPEHEAPPREASPTPPDRAEAAPPPPPPARSTSEPSQKPSGGPTRTAPDLPFTWPVMLSGWLIGAGSGLGALTLIPVLGNPLNLLLFLALLAIAATVFLADRMPRVPHQRLATFAIVLVAFGVALERAAFRVRGIDTIFLVMVVAAAAGALLLELGRDRPVPPPGGAG